MNIRTNLTPNLALLGLLLIAAAPATGHTWHVARDGSGDFSVIQDAVDAASSGDEIVLGPGRYTEYQTLQSGVYWFDLYVVIPDGMSLTFLGAGSESTIIGPEDPSIHENATYLIGGVWDIGVVARDIGFENCSQYSIGIDSGSVDVQHCRFSNSEGTNAVDATSIHGGFSGGAVIRDCQFSGNLYRGIATINSPGGVLIERCTFETFGTSVYAWTSNSRDVQVRDCTMQGSTNGIGFGAGAGGLVENCHLVNCAIELYNNTETTITNCTVTNDNGMEAMILNNNDPFTITDNIFQSNGKVIYTGSYGLGIFRNNHIIQTGSDYLVYSPYHPSFHQDIDMSGNWWGTTDTDVIDAGIYDCHDDPMSYHCVIYLPLADGPVPTEARSWSEVKGMFR